MTNAVVRRNAALALAALHVCSIGCDVDPSDIRLDQRTVRADSGDDAGRTLSGLDSGPQDASPTRAGSGGSTFPGMPPNDHIDAGPDTHESDPLVLDAAIDAGEAMQQGDELDSGSEDAGDSGVLNPCDSGLVRCPFVWFKNVVVDWGSTPPAYLTARAVVDGYMIEGTSRGGAVALHLPAGRVHHVYLSAPGTWRLDLLVKVPTDVDSYDLSNYSLFTDNFFAYYFGLVDQSVDTDKGEVLVAFAVTVPGAGVMLNHPSSPALVSDQNVTQLGNTLLPGGKPFVNFIDADPGTFTPTPISPPGYECAIALEPGHPFEASPRTVTWIPARCAPSMP